jgi:hypothetical protein
MFALQVNCSTNLGKEPKTAAGDNIQRIQIFVDTVYFLVVT